MEDEGYYIDEIAERWDRYIKDIPEIKPHIKKQYENYDFEINKPYGVKKYDLILDKEGILILTNSLPSTSSLRKKVLSKIKFWKMVGRWK